MSSTPFRFVTSSKRGQYSVWRGDTPIGYITKIVHTINVRGLTRTKFGWRPTTLDLRDLAGEKTRDDAARTLWLEHNR